MRLSKFTCLVCACALAFSSLAPLSASGHSSDSIVMEQIAPPTGNLSVPEQAMVKDDQTRSQTAPTRPKKRPNLFVRIITAPFRGLAKLFGGGKADQTARAQVKAKKAEAQAAQANAPASQPMDAPRAAQATPISQPAQPVKTTVAAQPVRAATTAPSAASMVAAQPLLALEATPSVSTESRQFTPFIEGVRGDPLSQGRALLENGYTNEAIAELSVAAIAGPDLVEANNLLGLAYDRRGQHKQAQEFYERALTVAPQNARVLNNLGHSLYLADRYNDALARLKAAARLSPADTQVANNLALVYGRLGKYNDAFKQFSRAGSEFYARMNTAALLVAAGRDRDAIKHYEAARKINPASSDVLRQLIALYVRTGQRDKAEAAQRDLNKALDTSGGKAVATTE